jgi:NAD(P)-dependent dehydrogenase (short-subunit alcohol dehydrogenase family)
MESTRFDGRVAIVTGAGRGIGRAHALQLAQRGAKVVVNDLGSANSGHGHDKGPSEEVVEEILAAGGEAVADASDVSSPEGAARLVQTAVSTFGGIDILVNNAGMFTPGEFPEVGIEEMRRYFDVHAGGSFLVARECWPHMTEAGYGRIVMTTSHGILGAAPLLAYGTAKGSVFALARTLAVTGRELGIRVNSVAPVAATRMAGGSDEDTALVSPLVLVLCHESCPVNGETFLSGGRRHARLFVGETEGYVHAGADLTPEVVAEHWPEIMDESRSYVPEDTMSWMEANAARIAAVPVK